jgi:Fe-S-cluster containining protein
LGERVGVRGFMGGKTNMGPLIVLKDLFENYLILVAKANHAFKKVTEEHGSSIKCRVHCADCCHAVFGLFPIEAAYLKENFDQLPRKDRREVLARADRADRELRRMEVRMAMHEDNPQMKALALASARVPCPLLSETRECILYSHRPITCRVYGIPTAIHGKAHVCGKADFKRGGIYSTFDLDATYRELFRLSTELLIRLGNRNLEAASFVFSVSRALRGPIEEVLDDLQTCEGRHCE